MVLFKFSVFVQLLHNTGDFDRTFLSAINALSQILQNLLGELPPYYQSLL